MNFFQNLFSTSSSPKQSAASGPTCDKCGKTLIYAGCPIPGDDNANTWKGTVCISCKKIYCNTCNVVDAVPCPNCGTKLKPAMTIYLRQAGR